MGKFLKTLECYGTRFFMESLGSVIKHCNHLERIGYDSENVNSDYDDSDDGNFDSDDCDAHDSFCHLLEQVPNPGICSLPLYLSLVKCSTDAIKHKTLKKLLLKIGEINLTSAAVEAFCQLLPELLALEALGIDTLDVCGLVLFGLVDLVNSRSLPSLKISGLTDSSAEAVTRLIYVFNHNIFRELKLEGIHLTPVVAVVLGQLLSKLSALRTLKTSSLTECSDEAVTRLIDGINHKTFEEVLVQLRTNCASFTS